MCKLLQLNRSWRLNSAQFLDLLMQAQVAKIDG